MPNTSNTLRSFYRQTVDRTGEPPPFNPDKKVWANVLLVAMQDIVHPIGHPKRKAQLQRDARAWVNSYLSGMGSCIFVCGLLDMPISRVRAFVAQVPCLL